MMAEVPKWSVKGYFFDVCRCDVLCPCTLGRAPDDDECNGILAYHIDQGRFGDLKLDGLNLVALGTFKGNIWSGEAKGSLRMGFFIDERADERQREAIPAIFSGQAGGVPAQLGEIWGEPEMMGVEFAPVTVERDGSLAWWRAEVPGKVTARGEAIGGRLLEKGARTQVINAGGSETGPGQVATVGESKGSRGEAFGVSWRYDGTSSKLIPFDWSGP